MKRDLRLWLFQRWLAAVFVIAWASLGSQVLVLSGSRGLVPLKDVLDQATRTAEPGFGDFPTLFRLGVSDTALSVGCLVGVALSSLLLVGVLPRLLLAVHVVGYLSYAVACTLFLSFQWDNLLLECGAMALVLGVRCSEGRASRDAPDAPWRAVWRIVSGGSWRVFLFRVILFKLYFESGVAKLQSHLGDWIDGSAMTHYYETAPLPTPLAWYAHGLPDGWHRIESWGTLGFEVLGAFFVFSPRPTRLALFFALNGFQLVNIATANYGFFSYLAIGLHVFLLDPSDLLRLRARSIGLLRHVRLPFGLGRRGRNATLGTALALARLVVRVRLRRTRRWFAHFSAKGAAVPARARFWTSALLASLYLGISIDSGVRTFVSPHAEIPGLTPLARAVAPFRLINTYHLFGHITQERVEPEFQTFDGTGWRAHALHYKPGPIDRWPSFVAPHQPRVDFQLWFYGLRHARPAPLYVSNLLRRLCSDPDAVEALFVMELPEAPRAARVAFFRQRFSSPSERHATGHVWLREAVGKPRTLRCPDG